VGRRPDRRKRGAQDGNDGRRTRVASELRAPIQATALALRAERAIGVAFLLAGCSNNPNPVDWNREPTYFFAFGSEPQSFDPSVSYNSGDAAVMDPVYPSYFRYNFLKQNPWELELDVGLAAPRRQPLDCTGPGGVAFHGETWTFEIRHDLRFQNDPCFAGGKGRPVIADDVVYAFKRMADPKVEFPLASNLADKVLGWDEYSRGFGASKADAVRDAANYDRPMPGVRVDSANPYRFTVSLNQPYPQLRYLMAMHFTTPIAREAVDAYGNESSLYHMVGCGLFRLAEYTPHDRIVLVHNENSAGATYPTSGAPGIDRALLRDAGKPLPFLKRVEFRIITEPITSYNLFDQGFLDSLSVGQANAPVLLHASKPGTSMSRRGIEMLKGAYPTIEYLAFNMQDPTFGGYTPDKRKLRQAISLSVDSESYVELMNQGLGVKADFLIPRGLGGYDPSYTNPYRQYDPNLTRARTLLAEAGYPGGVDTATGERLTLYYDNYVDSGPSDRQREEFIRKQVQALGIAVVSRDTTYAEFVDRTNHKKVQFFNYGWVADYPDAENFAFLLYGPNESPGPNNANYHNPEYDRLFEQMRGMDDGPARNEIIRRMRDLAVEDCPWIYLSENEGPTMYQPWVRNSYSNPILSNLLDYRGIDVEKRERLQTEWNRPVWAPLAIFAFIAFAGVVPAAQTVHRHRNRSVRKRISGEAA
jgi:oligopeptide transport system substrate-binding protein